MNRPLQLSYLAVLIVVFGAVVLWLAGGHAAQLTALLSWSSLPEFCVVVVLTFANLSVSVVKYQALADERVRFIPALQATALGAFAGNFVPVQASVAASRSLAAKAQGRLSKASAVATFHEQAYDAVVVLVAGLGGLVFFLLGPVPAAAIATALLLGAGWFVSVTFRLLAKLTRAFPSMVELFRKAAMRTGEAGRLLLFASAIRYLFTLVRALLVLHLVGFGAALANAAAAYPLIQLSASLPFSPGGLGVVEASWTAILVASGSTLSAAASAAIAMRLVVATSQLAVLAIAFVAQRALILRS